jgi:hypothetical protein
MTLADHDICVATSATRIQYLGPDGAAVFGLMRYRPLLPSVSGRVPNCVTTDRLLVQSRSGVAWSRRKVRFFN